MSIKKTFSIDENIDRMVRNVVKHSYIENDEKITYSEALRRIILSSSLVSDCLFMEEGLE